jgi:peptidoglycan hydrolase-like protein with peptidoglycan-binding domain
MRTIHVAAALLALGGLAALPACSMDRGYSHSSEAAPQQQMSPGMVRQVQTALQQQGFYNGNIDGQWGPATQGALQAYQQAHGLTVDGALGPKTLASLNLPADGSMPVPVAAAPASTMPVPATPPPVNTSAATPATPPPVTTSAATPATPVAAPAQ